MNLRNIFVKIKLRHNISFLQNTHIKRKWWGIEALETLNKEQRIGGEDFAENGNQNCEGNRQRRR